MKKSSGGKRKAGIAVACVVVLLAVAVLGYYVVSQSEEDDSLDVVGTWRHTYTAKEFSNRSQTEFYSGIMTISVVDGMDMKIGKDIDVTYASDLSSSELSQKQASIKRYTTDPSELKFSYWPADDPAEAVQDACPFLYYYSNAHVTVTFSNGLETIKAYKFTYSPESMALYVGEDGVVYEVCLLYNGLNMDFIMDGWERTSSSGGYYK